MIAAAPFSDQEWTVLAGDLRLKPASTRDPRSLAATALLDEHTCVQLLDALAPVIRSPNRVVTASLLGKRVAFLTTGACLYALSVYDKGLRLSPDNCIIEYGHDQGLWSSSIPLHSIAPCGYRPGGRDAWREVLVQTLFADLLAPLWQTFHRVSGVSLRILWENTAVRVYSLYERRMTAVETPAVRRRAERDFEWLLHQASPTVFGLDYNPLQRFRQPLRETEGGGVRFRRTCCLYFKATAPVAYCSTCPLPKPEIAKA